MVFLKNIRYLLFAVTYFLFSIMSTKWLNTSSFLSWKSNANCQISFWYIEECRFWMLIKSRIELFQMFHFKYDIPLLGFPCSTSCKDYGVSNFWSHSSHSILIETDTRYVLELKSNKHHEKFWIILNKFCWKFSNI